MHLVAAVATASHVLNIVFVKYIYFWQSPFHFNWVLCCGVVQRWCVCVGDNWWPQSMVTKLCTGVKSKLGWGQEVQDKVFYLCLLYIVTFPPCFVYGLSAKGQLGAADIC